jgi:hypothetical protein
MKITIDLNQLKNEDGYFNESETRLIEKATGKSFSDVLQGAQNEFNYSPKFTDEQIQGMSEKEYAKHREAILNQLKQ